MASMHPCLSTRTWIIENILEVVITTRPCSTPTMRWRTEWRQVTAWPFFMTVSGRTGIFYFKFVTTLSLFRPVYNPIDEREDTNALEPITAQPDMFSGEVMDVTSSGPSSNIPYIVYSNEQNPWSVMEDGEDTDHLYKRMGQSTH